MPETYKDIFPKRMKERRLQLGKTQDDVAEFLGMQRTSIAHYEMGRNLPLTDTLLKIAECLETSIDYLLGKTESPVPMGEQGSVLLSVSIDNLADLPLVYNGRVLTPEQKRQVVHLLRAALNLTEGSNADNS